MAEKKTTKKVAPKTTKKPAVKKVESKKVEVKECNCGCNCTGMLNNIFYCLLVIIVLLGLILVVDMTKDNTKTNSTNTEEANDEYDVSMFEELTTTEAITKINKGDKVVLYIGRPTCHYCVQFLPNLQKAQKEYGYKTVYVDLEKITSDDQIKWAKFGGVLGTYDETCQNTEGAKPEEKCGQFGFTPMIVVFENGKIKDDWVGYSEYDAFAAFLEDNGFKN